MPDSRLLSLRKPSQEEKIEIERSNNVKTNNLRSLVGKYALTLLMNLAITYFIYQTGPDSISSPSICSLHFISFIAFQIGLCCTLVIRYFADATQFYATDFHRSVTACGTIIGIQLAADFIHWVWYDFRTIYWIPISIAQLIYVFCLKSLLNCPCKYCLCTPVVQFTYKNTTITFANQDKCTMKIIASRLSIPVGKFLICDASEVNYYRDIPFTDSFGRINLEEERSYVVMTALPESTQSDFNEVDSLTIHRFVHGLSKKTPEVARVLLENHPLVKNGLNE